MNIVYKITFNKRKENNILPYYYIGSKTNCTFNDGLIYDKRNKPYYGSSKYKNYKNLVSDNIDNISIEILFEGESFKSIIQKEQEYHLKYDVVMSLEYFNLNNAMDNNFHNPDYALMINIETNKKCRILKNHPDVLSGKWVGITANRQWFNNGEISGIFEFKPEGWVKGRLGDFTGKNNPFYGKKHTKENLKKGVKTRKENGTYIAWNKGITGEYKHSDETKRKMSELRKEKSKGENNPMFGKKVINNGVINKIINKDESLPNGWNYGRLKKS